MSNVKKARILAIGQAGRPTGYARVMSNILSRLADEFDVTLFGVDYQGPASNDGYSVVPNKLLGDQLGKAQLPRLLKKIEPDLVFMCHDHTFYSVHQRALDEYRSLKPKARVVVYCPIEWADTPPGNFTPLAGTDCVVFYTDFGLKVFEQAAKQTGITRLPMTAIIPHGVDISTFFPLAKSHSESRQIARLELFPGRPDLQGAFIVLNANRNCPRKRIDLTLRAFAEFSLGKPDTYLYLHMGMIDTGFDILAIASELSISDRLLLTTSSGPKPTVPDYYLNLIYNASNVGINTSTGEGWGFTALEHAATMGAQLVPNHSACQELWNNYGCLIGLDSGSGDQGIVSISKMVEWLNRLYGQPDLVADLAERGYRYALSDRFSWQRISVQWKTVFAQLLGSEQLSRVIPTSEPGLSFA